MKNSCIECIFGEQGKTCSFCSNPNQTNKDYKKYVYWTYTCDLYEKGISKSRIEYQLKNK